MKAIISDLLLCLWITVGVRAATFSVTPSMVSNDYTGLITFHMSGLSPGETVQVVQYYDLNGNGILDAADLPVRGERVTDGEAKLVNGATNINVFRDGDGLANGTITTSYRFALAAVGGSLVGTHIFRVSSPSNHFAATDLLFTVASTPHTQTVQGTVSNNSTNIPYAIVGLVQNVVLAAGPPKFIVGGTADANGRYTLKAPVGTYLAVAFQLGYVGNLLTFPMVVLTSNATATADITLLAATTSISGSLLDSTNSDVHAVPYAEMAFTTTNGFVTIAVCDSNANFSVPVTAGVWTPGVLPQSANSQSYLVPDAATAPQFDTLTHPVTNAVVLLKHSTALIFGRVVNNLGQPIAGVSLFANADFGQYNAFVSSDNGGEYSLALDAGVGTITVQNTSDPPLNNYIWPTPQFGINNGQALSLNVTGMVATAHIRGQVVDDTGVPLSGLRAAADSAQIYGTYTFATTDAHGYFDMPVFGGTWNFAFFDFPSGLVFPDALAFRIADGVNVTNDIVARRVTGTISGSVQDTGGHGITNIAVAVTNQVGSLNFTLQATTDTAGTYSVGVFNGTWNVAVDEDALNAKGYIPVARTNVTVPPTNAVANFLLSSVPPPQILTTNLPDATIGGYYSTSLEVTNGSYPTFWSLTSGALPDGLALDRFGYISGSPTNLGVFGFTLTVRDSRGNNDVRTFSIRVRSVPTGPPQLLTSYLADSAAGCPYTNQFRATNGTAPYVWALAVGSDPLPPGLSLATNGTLYGTPSSNSFFMVMVQVSGADGATTNGAVQIQVNAPLQIYASPLPPGTVGASYVGALSASGGAQPQSWSVVSNSLPPNLTLDPASGSITGIPSTEGIYHFTLRVTDGCITIDTATSLTNSPALHITTAALPVAPLNVPYNVQLQAAGGQPPYVWSDNGTLPFGLTLQPDGSLTGSPSVEGTNEVSLLVYDAIGGSATRSLSLVATSKPVLDLPVVSALNQFSFRVTGVPGQGYTLQSATDLTHWVDLFLTNAPTVGFYLTDTNASGTRRFYRLKVNP